MDATVTDVSPDGRVHIEKEGWSSPTLQERRAIIYAAGTEIEVLQELVDLLQAER